MRNSRFILPRCQQSPTCLCTIFLFLLSLGASEARTPRYPEIKIIRGKTLAGHPYMGGGISADEQRAMEREAKSYNLKLVFTRLAGTPMAPSFLMIGANDSRRIDKIVPRGPWFYIKLPPGGYTILARFARQVVLVKNVKLREGGRATFRLRGD